jgi:DNA mismatch repair ATPase MutS
LRKAGGLFQEGLALLERLRRLEGVLVRLEDYGFLRQPALRELCSPLLTNHQRPSKQIRRARWIASAASLQQNPVVWLAINAILPWDLWVANRLAQTRDELRVILPGWLNIWYELEALSSLATFAVLNPGTSFPQVEPAALFDARGLGHPLIHAEERVTNDFVINELGSTTIITGSNMSGKSSFLRTMGINVQLAYCGSVVCAAEMKIGLFRVFTSIRISDSVVDGFSYFYAEVRRLKSLLDALEQVDEPPLFYLIDEIFRGTNNRERLTGSRAYIRALAGRHGVGFIATHDLELVKLETQFEQVQNFHFREAVIEGKMVFDYRLRPGPCPTTNALKIMALVGLPVDGEDHTDGGV